MNALPAVFHDPLQLYYLSVLVLAWPVARIFRRAGFSPLWALLLGIPFVGYIAAAGVLALKRWPALPRKEARGEKEGKK